MTTVEHTAQVNQMSKKRKEVPQLAGRHSLYILRGFFEHQLTHNHNTTNTTSDHRGNVQKYVNLNALGVTGLLGMNGIVL